MDFVSSLSRGNGSSHMHSSCSRSTAVSAHSNKHHYVHRIREELDPAKSTKVPGVAFPFHDSVVIQAFNDDSLELTVGLRRILRARIEVMGGPGTDTGFTGCSPRVKKCLGELGVNATGPQSPRYPCFLKTIVEYNLNSWMQIPTAFVDLHGDKFCKNVDLEGPNGTVWLVNVFHTTSALVGFGLGWTSFVADNNLKKGNQILFTLVSKSRFTVHIFNKSGLETATSLGINADPVKFNSKRKSEQFEDEDSGRIDSENVEGGGYETFECGCQSPPDTPSQAVHLRASLRLKRAKLERAEQGPCIQEISLEYGLKEGKVTSERKISSSQHSQEKDPATELLDYERQSSKEPGYISSKFGSQRRGVTDAERTMAKIAALSLQSKSKKPSVVVLMLPSQVYRGFWLNIPKDFSKKHLPTGRCPIKLQDTAGFQWPATWIRNAQRSGVSGGWGGFSKDHRLEEGDCCVFELLDPKRYTFLVNIFRVVEIDLVPGTRGEWRKPHNMAQGLGYTYHQYPNTNQLKAKNFKLGSSSLKNTLAKNLCAEVRKGRAAECQKSGLNKLASSVGEGDGYLKNSRRERATQGNTEPNSDELDVKQEIAPLGFTHKNSSETPAPIKVQEESISKSDFYPATSAPAILKVERRSSHAYPALTTSLDPSISNPLEQTSKLYLQVAVNPEAVNPPSVAMEKEGKVWYPVNRLISRRQSNITLEVEFLVELEGRVMQKHGWGPAERDVRGHRWVPYTHFSPDFASCFLS